MKLTYDPASGALQSGSVFYYGPSGELIGQTDYSGTTGQRLMTRYWLWLDSLPLAQVEVNYTQGAPSGGRILYLHPDHLNAPRIATSQQAIVWTRNSDAFGATLPNEDVDGNGVATHIPLRFSGQYYFVLGRAWGMDNGRVDDEPPDAIADGIPADCPRLCTKGEVVNTAWRKPARPWRHSFRELVEACHDPAILFQPAKHALDDFALSVLWPIKQSG